MFDFTECSNKALGAESDPSNFPLPSSLHVFENCAQQLKYNWTALTTCAHTDAEALQNAAAKTGNDRGIHFAPTVFVAGKEVSTMSGVDPKVLLAAVCKAYTGPKPAGCKNALEGDATQIVERSACKI